MAVLLVLTAGNTVLACDCVVRSPAENFQYAEVVFEGTVIRSDPSSSGTTYKFRVEKLLNALRFTDSSFIRCGTRRWLERHFRSCRSRQGLSAQTLLIHREIGERRGEGNDLWNMSLLLDQLGERAQAIHHAEQALIIFEQIEDPNATKVRAMLAAWREVVTQQDGESTAGETDPDLTL